MTSRGRLIFIEHGCAPDLKVRRRQDLLTPVWRNLTGGCHLNRNVESLLERAGYCVLDYEAGFIRGPRYLTFTYRGIACKSA